MPMDSSQIASLVGGFNSNVTQGMQHSAMISQMYGGYTPFSGAQPTPTSGQQFAGMGMNMMGNMGMSAMGSQRLNNFGGGVMQPVTQSGQMLMGQTMYGAHQQQMLDANLQQSYRFQNSFGGRGFTQNETAGMGADLRSMAMMRGPGGQQTSFEELGRLASNMGRMGMAEGVRSAKDFNEKFKQMLTTVKTVAEELGSSLEEAQKVMASMKGSGVFRNQGQFTSLIRNASNAGGLSSGELSGMAMIGSQISRSVGGLGSSGAEAGVNALGNIGAARKAGIISEEDIYNVTGMQGAEGRRAFAQRNLQSDAQFFSGGLGRRALAAMAGKDGKLDMNDVQSFMDGGVSTGKTMSMAYQNLGEVGRANFIRNEGRLRGEAMKEFGGLGKAIVARNWLEERGMNMNEMDDRSMLFFQRKFGVGRDEADQTIKMARSLPLIMERKRQSAQADEYSRTMEEQQRRQDPVELLKRAEMMKAGVQNAVRQTGSDLYGMASTRLGELLAGPGEMVRRERADLAGDISASYMGGRAGKRARERSFTLSPLSDSGKAEFNRLFGSLEGGMEQDQFDTFMSGQGGRLREQGFDPTRIKTVEDYNKLRQDSINIQQGLASGGSQALQGQLLHGSTSRELRDVAGSQGISGTGQKFLDEVGSALKKLTTEQGKELAKSFEKATKEEQAKIARDVLGQAGMGKIAAGAVAGTTVLDALPIVGGRRSTLAAENRDIGKSLSGLVQSGDRSNLGGQMNDLLNDFGRSKVGKFLGVAQVAPGEKRGGISGLFTGMAGAVDDLLNWADTGSERRATAAGEFLRGKEGRSLRKSISGESTSPRGRAIQRAEMSARRAELRSRQKGGSIGSAEEAELTALQALEAKMSLDALGGSKSPEALKSIAERIYGEGATADKSPKEIEQLLSQAAGTVEALDYQERRDAIKQETAEFGERGRKELSKFDESLKKGTDYEKLRSEGKISDSTKNFMSMMHRKRSAAAAIGTGKGDDADLVRKTKGLADEVEGAITSGSLEEKKKMLEEMTAGGIQTEEVSNLRRQVSIEERLAKSGQVGTAKEGQDIAGLLGVGLQQKDLKDKTTKEKTQLLSKELGLDMEGVSNARRDEIEGQLSQIIDKKDKSGKGLSSGDRAAMIRDLQTSEEVLSAGVRKQDEAAKQNDPTYRALQDIKDLAKEQRDYAKIAADNLLLLPKQMEKFMEGATE